MIALFLDLSQAYDKTSRFQFSKDTSSLILISAICFKIHIQDPLYAQSKILLENLVRSWTHDLTQIFVMDYRFLPFWPKSQQCFLCSIIVFVVLIFYVVSIFWDSSLTQVTCGACKLSVWQLNCLVRPGPRHHCSLWSDFWALQIAPFPYPKMGFVPNS